MNDPLESIGKEHRTISGSLKILQKLTETLEFSPSKNNLNDFSDLIIFLKIFIGLNHFKKEENILFPEIEDINYRVGPRFVDILIMDHQRSRSYTRDMEKILNNVKSGGGDKIFSLVNCARNYISIVRRHIAFEEAGMLKIAKGKIYPEDMEKIFREFEFIGEEVKKENHKEFGQTLQRLGRIYG